MCTFVTLHIIKEGCIVDFGRFEEACKARGTTPTAVMLALGMSRSNVTKWRRGETKPKLDALEKIAEYLGVTVDYLTGKDDQKEKPVEDDGPNTLEEAREILRQRGIRVLLDAEAKDFTPEQIKQIVNFILFTDEQSEK